MHRIVVCGGRGYADRMRVGATLAELHERLGAPFMIAQGGAKGADKHAREWADLNGIGCVTYHAAWGKLGTQAGPARNQMMLAHFKPDMVYAFPGDKGTASCVEIAKALNIPVTEIPG